MKVPSGRVLSEEDIALLLRMNHAGFIRYSEEPFKLKSGIFSNVYVYGRGDLTSDIALEWQVGEKIADMVSAATKPEDGQVCLVGLPSAGTPFAQAGAMAAHSNNITPNGFPIIHQVMKEKVKGHGANQGWFNGDLKEDRIYWRVDNVATSGTTIIECEGKFGADGYPTVYDNPEKTPVLIFVDRQQGAIERLKLEGFTRIEVAFNLLDITHAYREMEVWPASSVDAVEKEIREHQERCKV